MTSLRDEREAAFRACYGAHYADLLAYAVRRVDDPADAADVVADTFLTAWRRFADVPHGEEARLWLFGVARKVLANQRRGGVRRQRLGEKLRTQLDSTPGQEPTTPDHAEAVARRQAVLAAMNTLGEADREVLALTAWEHLEPREIAAVLGVSPEAVRTRLTRARSRFKKALGHDAAAGGHVLAEDALARGVTKGDQ